ALQGQTTARELQVSGKWLDVRVLALQHDDGELLGAAAVVQDITERRQLQDDLHRASKLESIGVLAGGIAHDFNNILTAIVGNLSLARLCLATPEETAHYLDESESAALRARALTQQLLTFAKGGQPVRQPIALDALLAATVQDTLRGSNVHAEMLVSADLWRVDGDEGQLTQVLHNIVRNAQQAMPGGGVLTVCAQNVRRKALTGTRVGAGEYVRLEFADRGLGIAPEHLGKIFDPFFTTKADATGLGLSTAYRIVQQHGGALEARSRREGGAVFEVLLPRSVKRRPASSAMKWAPKGRVLFMDDEEPLRRLACDLLTRTGYEVVTAAHGDEALRLFDDSVRAGAEFDVVIVDLTVRGGMGGLETLRALRERDHTVPVVVSSGYSDDPVMADCARFGFAGQVVKPYAAEALVAVLESVRPPS
ncbi:MAG TPA: ATP-binding protein, partial [Acidiferrobacteraceae bacterium]|nr:ATP-binding protein [Acidiferrobacteraceae bacterium]